MNVLVSLNNNGNSRDESKISITASGQEVETNPGVLTAYQVNNVTCLFEGLEQEPKVFLDIVGKSTCGLQVSVANQEAGEDLIRRLCKDGHLDLTNHDVCLLEFDEPQFL